MSTRLHIQRHTGGPVNAACSLCGVIGEQQYLDSEVRMMPGAHGFVCLECGSALKIAEITLLHIGGISQPLINTPNH